MASKRFKFLTTEAFTKLSQREKIEYLARATSALGKRLGIDAIEHSGQHTTEPSPGTLGAVLYAGRSKNPQSETEWAGLVDSVAAGDQFALHGLYERTHRPVFTLIMKIVGSRETA